MHLLERVVETPHACSYLPAETASLEVEILLDVGPQEMQDLLEHGWRRFGPMYFRPGCAACSECIGLRVIVSEFSPSKTQRRVARGAKRFRRVVATPSVDEARLDLYSRWHAEREDARGWEPNPQPRERYKLEFAFPHPSAREAAFYDDEAGGRLVGLGLFDATPHALSATFFFHDPAYARASLGVANVLALIDDARDSQRPHVYLGFRVAGCASLRYKATYRPHELLKGRPGKTDAPVWERAPTASTSPRA
jgi:arginyl-tRNA--protein-N-Asp/Glu arginylyltransferase